MKPFILAFISILFLNLTFAQKRPFTISDLYKIKSISGAGISKSGQVMCFLVTNYNLTEGKSNTSVVFLSKSGNEYKKIEKAYSPFFSKDGKSIFFIAYKKGVAQLYKRELNDTAIVKLTDFYTGINFPKLSPDGNYIIFQSKVFPECGADSEANKKISQSMKNGPIQAHLSDKLFVRHWTEYVDGKFNHIFMLNLKTKKITDLTPGNWNSPTFKAGGGSQYDISPDSKYLVFESKRVENPAESTNSDLFLLNIKTKELINLTKKNLAWDGEPKFSPDGKKIAFKFQKIPNYESDRFRLAIYDLKTKEIKVLTEEIDNWVSEFEWSANSKEIYFTIHEKGYMPLLKINLTSNKVDRIIKNKVVSSFKLNEKFNEIIFLSSTVGNPYELYSLNERNKKITQLTFVNQKIKNEVDIRPAESIWVKTKTGEKIHVFIVKPHNFIKGKKYPLVLNVHGGPQYQWMDSFRGDWQIYPGSGYVLAFPNPHGSTGYGQKFTKAISEDWGGLVFDDLMQITDSLENLDYVDPERIGAMGWSYGGYMMNWFQAKTKRFKCLVSMMGLYDMNSFYGVTEELWFPEFEFAGTPWNSPLYKKYSPSNYVSNFSTPTLIITGERDYRVPYTQSLYYFTVLQKLKIASRLIVFKNDGHWPSHIKSMPLYYNAHLEWFHKYLGGKKAPYDSKKLIRNLAFK